MKFHQLLKDFQFDSHQHHHHQNRPTVIRHHHQQLNTQLSQGH
jgi:hypothetical protein